MLKTTVIMTTILAIPLVGLAAGTTERACLRSDRSPGQAVCACAQSVADQTLSQRDQSIAAKIIVNPDHFYKYYGSKNPRRKSFLERYRAWGKISNELCRK